MLLQGQTGPVTSADGAFPTIRTGRLGDAIVSELHGRFYEQTFRGSLYSGGMTLTAINAATFTSGTLGATCTPIAGVYNPASSKVNLVILQAAISITLTALTATGGGPFVWAVSTGNTAISTGNAPFSRLTLTQAGSAAKNMSGVALTGLTNNLVVMEGSEIMAGQPYNVSEVATAAGFMTQPGPGAIQNFDGSLIVPPGGVLALLATTTPVAHSAASRLLWEEVPTA